MWVRSDATAASLDCAHLDRQFVQPGDRGAPGDALGEVDNTGNAATTPPHLHFGLYARGGAVDSEPFVVGRRSVPRTERAG